MNEMAGVRLTGFARNLLWEGLAFSVSSSRMVNQRIVAGLP
jgi:hypothetical protein